MVEISHELNFFITGTVALKAKYNVYGLQIIASCRESKILFLQVDVHLTKSCGVVYMFRAEIL